MPLTIGECRELQSTYKFLRHISLWRDMMKSLMKRGGAKSKSNETPSSQTAKVIPEREGRDSAIDPDVASTTDNTLLADIGRKFGITIPYASDLLSADYFRLLNLEVPLSARSHMCSRELFFAEFYKTNGFSNGESYTFSDFMTGDIVWENNDYPLKRYQPGPTDLLTLVCPLLLEKYKKCLNWPKFRVEPNVGWYLSELFRISCTVSLNMEGRIRCMRPLSPPSRDDDSGTGDAALSSAKSISRNYSAAVARAAAALGVAPLAPIQPEFNIVVLDVFVDLPRPILKDNSRFCAKMLNFHIIVLSLLV